MKVTTRRILFLFALILNAIFAAGQSYTSFFTGNSTNIITAPQGGICMMGGATESDDAMRWFLQRAAGGDVLVLRASGSSGYNNYLYSELGVSVNSVETIVFNNATAANEPYIHQKIAQAEAIWFAGGDQWRYVSWWRNTAIDSLINDALLNRNIVIGGTSAGMAILGGAYFTAKNGTVTTADALGNPYHARVAIDSARFLDLPQLRDVITDTHYDNPVRKGRHVTFMARMFQDWGMEAKGIACDEYTAVCILPNGNASVYGGFPASDDNAYFIQTNCELDEQLPENCAPGMPLNWNRGGQALKVYKVKGTATGNNRFDLNDWKTGFGGTWEQWHVNNGVFNEAPGAAIDCEVVSSTTAFGAAAGISVFPNPTDGTLFITHSGADIQSLTVSDLNGRVLIQKQQAAGAQLDIAHLPSGMYLLKINTGQGVFTAKVVRR
jgi:cyanophycinase-like exopeptidase